MSDTLLIREDNDGICTLTLNRPMLITRFRWS